MRLVSMLLVCVVLCSSVAASTGGLLAEVAEPPPDLGFYSIQTREHVDLIPKDAVAVTVAALPPDDFDVLKQLEELRYLVLGPRYNSPALTTEAFAVVAELTNLTHLDAKWIPHFQPEWLDELGKSDSLEELNLKLSIGRLGDDPDIDYSVLASAIKSTGLTALDIEGSTFSGDPDPFLQAAKGLHRLVCHADTGEEYNAGLAGNPLRALAALPLIHLNVRSNKFEDELFDTLSTSKNLQSLALQAGKGPIDPGFLSALKSVSSLKSLTVWQNENIGDEHFEAISQLNQIRNLDLSRGSTFNTNTREYEPPYETYKVSSEAWLSIAAMPNLRVLRAGWAPTLNDDVLKALAQCESLRVLDLEGDSAWTAEGIAALADASSIEELHLDEITSVDDHAIPGLFEALSKCRGIRVLTLNQTTGVEAKDFAHLASLKDLRELQVAACEWVNDEVLQTLGKLEGLEVLLLHYDTHVTDAGISYLAGHNRLRTLGLFGCKGVTSKSIVAFESMNQLGFIDLKYTGVQGDEVLEFWRETRDQGLHISQYFKRED